MILTKTVLSTYSADTFGVCSALYELGGLIVMHDASGCNSTYNTHDEPRWYSMDSMVFISGVTEKDIIFGSDKKLIDDVCAAAEEEHPVFISLCGSPLPLATGTDFRAAAKVVERRTGIPAFGFPTNGMNTYLTGAGMAFEMLAGRVRTCKKAEGGACITVGTETNPGAAENAGTGAGVYEDFNTGTGKGVYEDFNTGTGKDVYKDFNAGTGAGADANVMRLFRMPEFRKPGNKRLKVNILGVTPLDFSVVGNVEALRTYLIVNGFTIRSVWAMGDTLDNILSSSDADVNLVVSATGFRAARKMKERFGIPFVTGVPVGKAAGTALAKRLREACCGEESADVPSQTIPSDGKVQNYQAGSGAGGETNLQAGSGAGGETNLQAGRIKDQANLSPDGTCDMLLIGEPVFISSLREELQTEFGFRNVRCICPMPDAPKPLISGMETMIYEQELRKACRMAGRIIADPFYARLLPEEERGKFISLPHEAYSGRYYRDGIPVFIGSRMNGWLKERLAERDDWLKQSGTQRFQ